MPKNNKQKKIVQAQQEAKEKNQKAQAQLQQQQQQHHHHHDHSNCGGHHDQANEQATPDLFSSLSSMIPEIRPDDPLPEFSAFDNSRAIVSSMIVDLRITIDLIQQKKYDALPTVPAQSDVKPAQPKKLTKQLQQQKDKALNDLKANISILEEKQKKLEKHQANPKLQGIRELIKVGIYSLGEDVKENQLNYKQIEQSYA